MSLSKERLNFLLFWNLIVVVCCRSKKYCQHFLRTRLNHFMFYREFFEICLISGFGFFDFLIRFCNYFEYFFPIFCFYFVKKNASTFAWLFSAAALRYVVFRKLNSALWIFLCLARHKNFENAVLCAFLASCCYCCSPRASKCNYVGCNNWLLFSLCVIQLSSLVNCFNNGNDFTLFVRILQIFVRPSGEGSFAYLNFYLLGAPSVFQLTHGQV